MLTHYNLQRIMHWKWTHAFNQGTVSSLFRLQPHYILQHSLIVKCREETCICVRKKRPFTSTLFLTSLTPSFLNLESTPIWSRHCAFKSLPHRAMSHLNTIPNVHGEIGGNVSHVPYVRSFL